MISVREASATIQNNLLRLTTRSVNLMDAVDRILAEPVAADRDFPPFHRVAMDGIAIQSKSFKQKGQAFLMESTQAAGSPQNTLQNLNSCVEVMTGAMLPQSTDAVIRYEDLKIEDGKAHVMLDVVTAGMNIHVQAQDARKGEMLLSPGQWISSTEVALLASVGKSQVHVFEFPATAVISNGDELVDVDTVPEVHQIRRSNMAMLQAAMKQLQWSSTAFHLSDNEAMIKAKLVEILAAHDVLILSGGVSKGKFDFIPKVLEALGIQKKFHQISQRPGKPFWFGTSTDNKKIVFALPGNPVSTFLCFYKYVKPWILRCARIEEKHISAILAEDINFNPTLTYFLQVKTEVQNGNLIAYPQPGGGSGDFVNLKAVDGFLELPAEKSAFKAGEAYPYISFR
jgi:molybdopterin molybdotransferase